jgi:pimeloyl-ACP methyl ester carboxylesterase
MVKRRRPNPPASPDDYGLAFEEVTFPSRYKVTLRGWWLESPSSQGTLILCHGQNGSMEGDLPLGAALCQAGYHVLMFNLRAHGNSEGDKLTFGAFEKEDLLGAVDFAIQQKQAQQVGIIGLSMGAGVAMIAAALTDKINVLVLDGVYAKFLKTVRAVLAQEIPAPLRPLAGVAAQVAVLGASVVTNTRVYQVSPQLWAKHIRHSPILFIHGEKDPLIPIADVQKLADDLSVPYRIWVVPGCGHREAFQKERQAYLEHVVAWLEQHLN